MTEFVVESLGPGFGKPSWYTEAVFLDRESAEEWLAENRAGLLIELNGLLRNEPGQDPFRIRED